MSCFTPAVGSTAGLDPNKRVNYRLGLVLGEDEFRQDQFHHRERDHRATRALHGYGTVSGLAVTFDDSNHELHVQPGLAVDPAGRLVCVPVEYCASLDGWLQQHASGDEVSGGLPASLPVYVVLCWIECATDDVPIPSDSCLSAEDSRAASRLLDSFELRLVLDPPPLVGEIAPGSPDGLAELVEELHGLLDVSGTSPPDMAGVAELLREWAVERRPEVRADHACLPAPDQQCVLLAQVVIDIADDASGPVVDGATVDDTQRPILVSTRLLQEAMFAVGADVAVPPHDHPHVHDLGDLGDVDLSAGAPPDSVLTFDGANWVPGLAAGGGVTDHAALTGLGADDHPQYLLADGSRPLTGDLSAGNHRFTNVLPSVAAGQAIVHDQGAGGDLSGSYPNPRLAEIQGVPVDAPAPEERQALMLRGGRWRPTMPTLLPLVTVQRVDTLQYVLWFHLDAPRNGVAVDQLDGGLEILRETDTGQFLRRVGPSAGPDQIVRNVFRVGVREESTPLRFVFRLDQIQLDTGARLLEWADEAGIWFCGQSGERGETVTAFALVADRLG
jgi:hypothetical protein